MNLQKAKEKVFSKPTANRKTQIPSSYFLSASDMIELSEIAQTCDNGIFEVNNTSGLSAPQMKT